MKPRTLEGLGQRLGATARGSECFGDKTLGIRKSKTNCSSERERVNKTLKAGLTETKDETRSVTVREGIDLILFTPGMDA